jgi:hypothetical protein
LHGVTTFQIWQLGFLALKRWISFCELLWANNWQNAFDGNELDETAIEFQDTIAEL